MDSATNGSADGRVEYPARNIRQDRIRVVIADDHAVMLDKIDSVIKPHFDVVGRAENGRELVDTVGKLLPAVVTTDIAMPELDGIGACRLITSQHAGVKVVVVSIHNDPTIVDAVFEAGASGYVWKPAIHAELIPAIESVLAGRLYRSGSLTRP